MADPRARAVEVKEGLRVTLRPALESDAVEMLRGLGEVASEAIYIGTEVVTRDEEEQRHYIRQCRDEPRRLLLVAEVNGHIAGALNAGPGHFGLKDAHVVGIGMWIRQAYREQGIGSAMLEYLIEWAGSVGFEKIQLEVFSTNQRAIALYRKYGFEVEGVQRRAFKILGEYVDGWFMGKFL